jgi:hypothetical protein
MYKVTPEMHPFFQANCYLILEHNRAFAPSLLLRTSIPSLIQVDLVHVKQRHLRLSTQVLIVYEVGLGFICEAQVRQGFSIMGLENTNLPLTTGERNVHKSAGVCDSLLRAALGGLLLLLRLNLLI